jgi:hypothetical protein
MEVAERGVHGCEYYGAVVLVRICDLFFFSTEMHELGGKPQVRRILATCPGRTDGRMAGAQASPVRYFAGKVERHAKVEKDFPLFISEIREIFAWRVLETVWTFLYLHAWLNIVFLTCKASVVYIF